jgi:hypothetical protein
LQRSRRGEAVTRETGAFSVSLLLRLSLSQVSNPKNEFIEQTDRHMGSKSMVAAPLWAERYYMRLDSIMQYREIMSRTHILHQQGFDDHMPVCHPAQMHFSG